MNKLTSIGLVSAFVLSASAFSAETIVFDDWADNDVSYTISADGLDFTLDLTLSGVPGDMNASGDGGSDVFGHVGGDSSSLLDPDDTNPDEFVTFTLSVSDASQLSSLSMNTLNLSVFRSRTQDQDIAAFDDGIIASPVSVAAADTGTNPDFKYGGGELLNGLNALTIVNVATWELTVASISGDGFSVDDISFDYIVVPEPGTYALLAGCAALGFVMLRRRK
jgi:hypothetical protein